MVFPQAEPARGSCGGRVGAWLAGGAVLVVLALGAVVSARAAFDQKSEREIAAMCESRARKRPAAERADVEAGCRHTNRHVQRLGPFDDEVGVVCVGLGVVLGVVALLCVDEAWRERRRPPSSPQRLYYQLTHVREAASGLTRSVAGTIVSPPKLWGPLTQRPCVAWAMALSEHDQQADGDLWRTVWRRDEVQDLEIAYDLVLTHDARQGTPEPSGVVARPGTVEIAGDLIGVAPRAVSTWAQEIAPDAWSPALLADLGIAEDLRRRLTADPHGYRLVELCFPTGTLVRCSQDGYSTRFSLDLDDQVPTDRTGCLGFAGIFLALSLCAFIVGFSLIVGLADVGE